LLGLAVYEDGGDEAHSYLPTLLRYLVCGSCELWKLCEFCRSRMVVAGGFPAAFKMSVRAGLERKPNSACGVSDLFTAFYSAAGAQYDLSLGNNIVPGR